MLFRGDTPLSPAEQLDFEIERALTELQDDGLLLAKDPEAGRTVWTKTLRGMRELDCPFFCREA